MSWNIFGFLPRTRPSTTQNTTASIIDEPDNRHMVYNDLGLILEEAPQSVTGRFHDISITRPERRVDVSKSTAETSSDLETLMLEGYHASLREGLATLPKADEFRIHSAILFETVKTGSGSSTASEMRYLPLVATPPVAPPPLAPLSVATPFVSALGALRRHRAHSHPERSTLPSAIEDRSWPLDVMPDTKRYIHDARARQSLVQTSTLDRAFAPVSTCANESNLPTSRPSWPPGVVPVELFEMITRTLSPRDIRNMRLVCKEFDSKSSPALFKEVVVPFSADLYDMIEDDVSARMSKGTAGANNFSSVLSGFDSYETHEDSIYCRKTSDGKKEKHGLRVFQGFGHHMNRFGIRFEVTEYDLATAPAKLINTKHVEAYHGGYAWPPSRYPRFGRLARLESSADETPRMTAALATLVNIREIGLSLDSGLGFLGGPDRSHHDMVFERPLPLFDEGSTAQRPHSDGATQFWSSLRQSCDSFNPSADFIQDRLLTCILDDDVGSLPTMSTKEYHDSTFWPTVKADGILSGTNLNTPIKGIFYTASESFHEEQEDSHPVLLPVSPNNLTEQQKQWILETGWAQSAFLDTYILALSDNPQVFHQVTKITISKISSGLLQKLDRSVFWSALPNAEDVTLLVSPDWRTVGKDDASDADLPMIAPSCTVNTFRGVVHRVSLLGRIKRLRIGYTDGGEYGKGMYGRNQHLMPAPITVMEQLLDEHPDVLSLDNIEDLTLVNCWLTPQMLKYLTNLPNFASASEKFLTLDSVSLTANTKLERADAFTIKLGVVVHEFREGSWPAIINDLAQLVQPKFPEPEIFDPRGMPTVVEQEPLPAPYKKFTFNSCGYTRLRTDVGVFDQSALNFDDGDDDDDARFLARQWFRRRGERIGPHMLISIDGFLGKIQPRMPKDEIKVLRVWGLEIGWPKGKGEEALYDGCVKGGEGRFSGCIQTT